MSLTINYYLDKRINKQNGHPIVCRIIKDRKKSEFKISMDCPEKYWDELKQQAKTNYRFSDSINRKLDDYKFRIRETDLELSRNGRYASTSDIKNVITGKSKQHWGFLEFADNYLNKRILAENNRVIIQQTRASLEYVKQFLQTQKKRDEPLESINKGWINDFEIFLKSREIDDYGRKFKNSTIHKHLTRVKTIFQYAENHDILSKNPFKGVRLTKPKSERIGLEIEELVTIIELDLTEYPEINRVRDCFVFCCFTGIRFSDAQGLTTENLKWNAKHNRNELNFIQNKSRHLSGKPQIIPVLTPSQKIIDRYSEMVERKINGKLLPRSSNQHSNRELKKLNEMANLDKPLSFHISRHTCGLILHGMGIEMQTIGTWLGHSSNSITSVYAQTTVNHLHEIANRVEKNLSDYAFFEEQNSNT